MVFFSRGPVTLLSRDVGPGLAPAIPAGLFPAPPVRAAGCLRASDEGGVLHTVVTCRLLLEPVWAAAAFLCSVMRSSTPRDRKPTRLLELVCPVLAVTEGLLVLVELPMLCLGEPGPLLVALVVGRLLVWAAADLLCSVMRWNTPRDRNPTRLLTLVCPAPTEVDGF